MTPLFRKFLGMNWLLFATMIGLAVFGVFSIYAASGWQDDPALSGKWKDQVIWFSVGIVVHFAAALIDYRWIRWGALPMYLAGIGGLVAVKAFGVELSGAQSWLIVGGQSVQPSQFAMLAGILILAVVLGELPRLHAILRLPFVRLALAGIIVVVPFGMVLKEPDIGSAFVWVPVTAGVFLVGSIPYRYLICIALIGASVLPVAYHFGLKPYQKARIQVFMRMLTDRDVDVQGDGWVPHHVRIAIASAGREGKGYLASKVEDKKTVLRMGFIPKDVAINDFIFATIAEERGFQGAVLLIIGLLALLLQCISAAIFARDAMGRLIVVGVVAMLFTHIFMNVGMCINLTPITGLPLPLISYGGTFALSCMFLLGMVQSVWVHRHLGLEEMNDAERDRRFR